MSVSTKTVKQTSRTDPRRILSSAPLWIVLVLIGFIWTLPTAGLLISSFRPAADIQTSGWWTAITHPFAETTRWTLENYESVITSDGMGNAFLNSLLVTIPSVVIPITIAAFAAYAFAWLSFPGRGFFFAMVVLLTREPWGPHQRPYLRRSARISGNPALMIFEPARSTS